MTPRNMIAGYGMAVTYAELPGLTRDQYQFGQALDEEKTGGDLPTCIARDGGDLEAARS